MVDGSDMQMKLTNAWFFPQAAVNKLYLSNDRVPALGITNP